MKKLKKKIEQIEALQSKTEGEIVCHRCKKPAVGRYTPNKDTLGLAFCEEHRALIGAAFYCLMTDNLKDFNELMVTDL